MRIVAASLALCGACVTEQHSEPDPAPAVQPRSCSAELTLESSAPSVQLGPYTLDRNGMTLCIHLDATQYLQAAHFVTESDYHAGPASSVASMLQDTSFVALQDSWDVSIGESTFSNLEWIAPLHVVTDGILWIHARDQAATSSFTVSLIEPYE